MAQFQDGVEENISSVLSPWQGRRHHLGGNTGHHVPTVSSTRICFYILWWAGKILRWAEQASAPHSWRDFCHWCSLPGKPCSFQFWGLSELNGEYEIWLHEIRDIWKLFEPSFAHTGPEWHEIRGNDGSGNSKHRKGQADFIWGKISYCTAQVQSLS